MRLNACAILISSLLVTTAASAQQAVSALPALPALPKVFEEPIALYTKVLGDFKRPISTTNPEAQAYFTQGFVMMYAFAKQEATRSFREAIKRDPNCAICYWGEAWSWGSYLNAPMTADEAPHAYAAAQKALQLVANATPKERDMIQAMSNRYVREFKVDARMDQEKAYADAMRPVYERYRDDLDIATLYADALFLLEPRRGSRDKDAPPVMQLHNVLEEILNKDIKHPGACHLYIHATESTTDPAKAEACAEFIGNAIPGASHINHMPSHTWNEVGRWGDSVRANIQAWHSDLKARINQGFAIYPQHNLHMLLYAASMDGQGAIAIQAGRDYTKLMGTNMYHVLTLVRFGRFDEIAAITERPKPVVDAGMWDFAQGYARLRSGETDFARAFLNRVLAGAKMEGSFRNHSASDLLGTVGGILEGEILLQEGNVNGAIAAFERAASLEDHMIYDEPEPLPFAARHWLGAALLEAHRYSDAERVYREELEDHPHNGWSLLGLKTALDAEGKPSPQVDSDLDASWSRSDTWIQTSKF